MKTSDFIMWDFVYVFLIWHRRKISTKRKKQNKVSEWITRSLLVVDYVAFTLNTALSIFSGAITFMLVMCRS
jgi:hypothetical protein